MRKPFPPHVRCLSHPATSTDLPAHTYTHWHTHIYTHDNNYCNILRHFSTDCLDRYLCTLWLDGLGIASVRKLQKGMCYAQSSWQAVWHGAAPLQRSILYSIKACMRSYIHYTCTLACGIYTGRCSLHAFFITWVTLFYTTSFQVLLTPYFLLHEAPPLLITCGRRIVDHMRKPVLPHPMYRTRKHVTR